MPSKYINKAIDPTEFLKRCMNLEKRHEYKERVLLNFEALYGDLYEIFSPISSTFNDYYIVQRRPDYEAVLEEMEEVYVEEPEVYKVEPDKNRKCRKCGRPCYPNYFFCKSCHSHVREA